MPFTWPQPDGSGTDLSEIVTYDERMAAAAKSMGFKV